MITARPRFGVAGNPPNFWTSEFRRERALAPLWLRSIGLDLLEIQCTRGVCMPTERRHAFRENAQVADIALSIHAPYYISLGTDDFGKQENSLNELCKVLLLAKDLNCTRVVFHPGAVVGDRTASLHRAIRTLQRFEAENDLEDVFFFAEIAGKVSQLGSLEEVIEISAATSHVLPCLDLAHLHARTGGSLLGRGSFERVLDTLEGRLGSRILEFLHVHLYPIDWGPAGEICHKAFGDICPSDTGMPYLPRYEPFIDLIRERSLSPWVVCEAKDSQDIGASIMLRYWQEE